MTLLPPTSILFQINGRSAAQTPVVIGVKVTPSRLLHDLVKTRFLVAEIISARKVNVKKVAKLPNLCFGFTAEVFILMAPVLSYSLYDNPVSHPLPFERCYKEQKTTGWKTNQNLYAT
jgi:hypothetical protein